MTTEIIKTDTDDGYLVKTSSVYDTARDSITGTVNAIQTSISVGQRLATITYYVYRGLLFFDTSSIPSDAIITSAYVSCVINIDVSTTDFDIVIQNGQPTYPRKPFVTDDFDRTLYSGDGGSINTLGIPSSFIISLNSDGKSWINKGGTTKLMLRSSNDINGISPTGNEYISIRSYNYLPAGGVNTTTLTINYILPNTGDLKLKSSQETNNVVVSSEETNQLMVSSDTNINNVKPSGQNNYIMKSQEVLLYE